MTAWSLTEAGLPEAEVIAALISETVRETWSARDIARLLALPGAGARRALDGRDGQSDPVGFALYRVAADKCELLSIGVVAGRRRRRLGHGLLAGVLAHAVAAGADRMYLEVAEDNAPAVAFYLAQGFVRVGQRPDYYVGADGLRRDALVLARTGLAGGE